MAISKQTYQRIYVDNAVDSAHTCDGSCFDASSELCESPQLDQKPAYHAFT
jgi:hypothetical protein